MDEFLEIEFKILLSKNKFYKMLMDLKTLETKQIYQKNYYFETPSFDLKERGMGLRVREVDDTYQLTLKQPSGFAKKEYNAFITNEQFNLLKKHKTWDHPIFTLLKQVGIPIEELTYFCSLSTSRMEIPYESGLLCFDENAYFTNVDYELEYEVTDEEQGKKEFLELIESYGLEYKINCISKVARAFNALYLETTEDL